MNLHIEYSKGLNARDMGERFLLTGRRHFELVFLLFTEKRLNFSPAEFAHTLVEVK